MQAKPNINGSAFRVVNWKERFLNPDGSTPNYDFSYQWQMRKGYTKMTDKRLKEYMSEKLATDGVYEIYCGWKTGSAHVYMAQVVNGKVRYFDPQSGINNASGYISRMKANMVGIIRIDDKIVNPKVANLVIKK